MTAHLAHLAILGIIKEASASCLGMLTVIDAQVATLLKRVSKHDELRAELEDVLVALDNARHILKPAVVLATQEHDCQVDAMRAADRPRLVGFDS